MGNKCEHIHIVVKQAWRNGTTADVSGLTSSLKIGVCDLGVCGEVVGRDDQIDRSRDGLLAGHCCGLVGGWTM